MNLIVNDIYITHQAWLQNWLRRRLTSPDIADDLAQDTFLSVLTRQSQSDAPIINEPKAYLTTIAKCILTNYYKRQSLESAYVDALSNLSPGIVISVEDKLILLQTLQEIDAMLETLPMKVRQAFLMLHLEGTRYAEIATKLEVSERTVKRYIAQAFEQCLIRML